MEFAGGILVGALVGVLATVIIQPPLERYYGWMRYRLRRRLVRRRQPIADDLADQGFLQLLRWTPSRPLDPRYHHVELDLSDSDEGQKWFPIEAWQEASTDAGIHYNGIVSSVTGYSVDHGESGPDSKRFVVTVVPSYYPDSVATQKLLGIEENWNRIREYARRTDGNSLLRTGPKQSFFVALSISTSDGYVLCVRRAIGGVATAHGLWSMGACETMLRPPESPGETPENFFDIARRAAHEEFGIPSPDLGHIWFSWFGVARPDGPMAIAHMEVSLTPEEVNSCLQNAEGAYESDAIRWIKIDSTEFVDLKSGRTQDGWLPFTFLVARGLSNFAHVLQNAPNRY